MRFLCLDLRNNILIFGCNSKFSENFGLFDVAIKMAIIKRRPRHNRDILDRRYSRSYRSNFSNDQLASPWYIQKFYKNFTSHEYLISISITGKL